MDAVAVMGVVFDRALDGAPHFNSGVVVELRVLAEGGAAPEPRRCWEAKGDTSLNVGVGIEELFERQFITAH